MRRRESSALHRRQRTDAPVVAYVYADHAGEPAAMNHRTDFPLRLGLESTSQIGLVAMTARMAPSLARRSRSR